MKKLINNKPKEIKQKRLPTEEVVTQKTSDEKKKLPQPYTPRDYLKKPTTSDVYGKKPSSNTKSTKMKDNLKSANSTSSLTQKPVKKTTKTNEIKPKTSTKVKNESKTKVARTAKDLPFVNVTVNSPPSERKLVKTTKPDLNEVKTSLKPEERARKQTRTLEENEIKLLTDETINNNAEMANLKQKLNAKPKAFFVNLEDRDTDSKDEEYDYEDDFESYESDFESYCSDKSTNSLSSNERSEEVEVEKKSNSDEERMLDSGSFDLNEAQKSANKIKPSVMDGITEDLEDGHNEKKSLTDEGFLDMSNSSGISSLKTMHNDVLESTILVDFNKSKQIRKKSVINEKLKQRAKDLLSMISLHEMSYTLFEMKPIPYDIYMNTFGKSNYIQKATQTFDDGVEEECQTEEVRMTTKWTQNPVKFSNSDIYLSSLNVIKKNTTSVEDFVTRFTDLVTEKNMELESDSNFKNCPLRIYLEQKDGVGDDAMLPMKTYNSKIENVEYSTERLVKFLRRNERKVFNALIGGGIMEDFNQKTNLTFSKGFKTIPVNINQELKSKKILSVNYSENKTNIFVTVHEKGIDKCLVCFWDMNLKLVPQRILVAIDNIVLCKLRGGSSDGVFVAALSDGSIHLWDLSEQPMWSKSEEKRDEIKKVTKEGNKTQIELDREWNEQNRDFIDDQDPKRLWSASAYTSSPLILKENVYLDDIIALEFMPQERIINIDGKKKIGQVCSLQRKGILTIWDIIEERQDINMGKAYWSKVKLEKNQTISLLEHPKIHHGVNSKFNLNSAKKRITVKRTDSDVDKRKRILNKERSVANTNTGLLDENTYPKSWEFGVLCYDLKIITDNDNYRFLIAKNCGEVFSCARNINGNRIQCFNITDRATSITSIETADRTQLFAGTDFGQIHLFSIAESRVLLTLDIRSINSPGDLRNNINDIFIGSVPVKPRSYEDLDCVNKVKIKSIQWSRLNPCVIFTLTQCGVVSEWNLTESDIRPRSSFLEGLGFENMILNHADKDSTMALLTKEGDVQIHLLNIKKNNNIFDKYVLLL